MSQREAQIITQAAAYLQTIVDAHARGRWTAVRRYRKGTTVLAVIDLRRPPLPGSNIADDRALPPTREDEARHLVALQPETARALIPLLQAVAPLARLTVDGETHPIVTPAVRTAQSILDGSW